jgi:hypothetical protein
LKTRCLLYGAFGAQHRCALESTGAHQICLQTLFVTPVQSAATVPHRRIAVRALLAKTRRDRLTVVKLQCAPLMHHQRSMCWRQFSIWKSSLLQLYVPFGWRAPMSTKNHQTLRIQRPLSLVLIPLILGFHLSYLVLVSRVCITSIH